MHGRGWYQVAFESELTREVTPAAVGARRLLLLRMPEGLRITDATCPHRGADLGHGGRLDNGAIVCPFHGFHIGIGKPGAHGLHVRDYPSLVIGGLVFARPCDGHDNGFASMMKELGRQRIIVPGFTLKLRAAAEMVIENAFDQAHFRSVHGIGLHGGFRLRPSETGELAVEGSFELPSSPWQRGRPGTEGSVVPFTARAFSPGLVVSHLGGKYPYGVITAATPTPEGGCIIRLSLALEPDRTNRAPSRELIDFLLRRSRDGLDRDRLIWEHRSGAAPVHYTPLDGPVRAFHDFCAGFAEAAR
jgi:nitrite reductase/ring-hydroxylating ferredoxin subunit